MRKVSLFIAAALIAMPAMAAAQSSASATVTVQANVLRGLSITPTSGILNFGTIISGQGTQPIVDPKSTTGGGVAFAVSGQTAKPVTVTYDASTAVGGGLTFHPDVVGAADAANRASAPAILSGGSVTLSAADPGVYTIWVGGNLTGYATATAGTYNTAVWNLSVAY